MEIDAHGSTCDVGNVVCNEEYVVTDEGAKTLVVVGIVAVVRSVCCINTGKTVCGADLTLLLRSELPTGNVVIGMLVIEGRSGRS